MKSLLLVALFLLVWPFSSGGKTYPMSASSIVPAASGTVKVKTENKNVILEIKVSHLAKPANLAPPASDYLVWVQPNGETAIKQGSLHIDGKLNGDLKAATTSRNFEVIVTAEQSVAATTPSATEVLRAQVKLDK